MQHINVNFLTKKCRSIATLALFLLVQLSKSRARREAGAAAKREAHTVAGGDGIGGRENIEGLTENLYLPIRSV
jgi:hypothetical protein